MKRLFCIICYFIFLCIMLPTFSGYLMVVVTIIGGILITFPLNIMALFIIISLRIKSKEFLSRRKEIRRKFLDELGWQLILFFVPIVLSEILIAISGGALLAIVSPVLKMCHLTEYVDELKLLKSATKISTKQVLKRTRK